MHNAKNLKNDAGAQRVGFLLARNTMQSRSARVAMSPQSDEVRSFFQTGCYRDGPEQLDESCLEVHGCVRPSRHSRCAIVLKKLTSEKKVGLRRDAAAAQPAEPLLQKRGTVAAREYDARQRLAR
jgi:hypothetical protein